MPTSDRLLCAHLDQVRDDVRGTIRCLLLRAVQGILIIRILVILEV